MTHGVLSGALMHKVEETIAGRPIRMLQVITADVGGFALEALWNEGCSRIQHRPDFGHVAGVSSYLWVCVMVAVVAPLIEADIRPFRLSGVSRAQAWMVVV